jgi:hypothetical protein
MVGVKALVELYLAFLADFKIEEDINRAISLFQDEKCSGI